MPGAFDDHYDLLGQEPTLPTADELIDLIDSQRSLLISVATGGPAINTVDAEYKSRHKRIKKGLKPLGIAPPFKWNSLWDWYGHYSEQLVP